MVKIVEKIENIFSFNQKNIRGVQVWMVYWNRLCGGYLGYYNKRTAKAFLSKKEAKDFVRNLKFSNDLIGNNIDLNIKIVKQ